MSSELRAFFKALITNPKEVSAIFPASKFLARAVIEEADIGSESKILELGPGSGAITKILLPEITQKKNYWGVDINSKMINFLQNKFPGFQFGVGSAAHLKNIIGDQKFDSVISSLPWSVIDETTQRQILDSLFDMMATKSSLVTYVYFQAVNFKKTKHFLELARSRFAKVEKKKLVVLNLPPAFVFKFDR